MRYMHTILFLFIFQTTYGQVNDTVDSFNSIWQTFFDEDANIYADKIEQTQFCKNAIIKILNENIVSERDQMFGKFLLAQIEYSLNHMDTAKLLYVESLESNVEKEEEDFIKNAAAKQLVNIHISTNEFILAEKYLELISEKYKRNYIDFGGYFYEFNYLASLYGMLYIKQKLYDKAIDKMLPRMFYEKQGEKDSLTQMLYQSLLQLHSKQELKNEFLEAKNTIYKKDNEYYLKLFGKEVEIPLTKFLINNENDKDELSLKRQTFTGSELYKLVISE